MLRGTAVKVARHIVEARRSSIANLVRERGYLPIQVISRQFKISAATARRDLDQLVNQKVLTRTHGGALSEFDRKFASADARRKVDARAKRAIGSAAASLVNAGMTLFIDVGTTPLAVAEALAARRVPSLCIVTASLAVARVLGDSPDIEIHLPAGRYLSHQEMLGGPQVRKSLRSWRFDLAFVGAEGLDADGLHNSQEDIVGVTHELRALGARVVLCLARSKLGARAPVRVAPSLDGLTLVTDATKADLARARVPLGSALLIQA